MFKKVLVVNDDEISLFVSCKMIVKTGFAKDVITAVNGSRALHVFDTLLLSSKSPNEVPEIVFLDLHMPVMDGWEFLEIFTEKYAYIFPAVRFIILSSSIDADDIQKLKRYSPVLELIRNPLNFEILKGLQAQLRGENGRFPHSSELHVAKSQMIV